MPKPPSKGPLDRLRNLWPFRKRAKYIKRHPAEEITDFSTQRDLSALLEFTKGLEQTHKHINPREVWGTGMNLLRIQEVLTRISKQNPQFDFDNFNVYLEIPSKKGSIKIRFGRFIKAVLTRAVKVEHLFEDTNAFLISTVLTALEIVERQPQTADQNFQSVFDALLRKYTLKRKLVEMREHTTLEEQYSVFRSYITEFSGLAADLTELDRLFISAGINTRKWFLAKIKQSLDAPELVRSGTLKEIFKAYALRQQEAIRSAEVVEVSESEPVQIIDLSLRIIKEIERLGSKYPHLMTTLIAAKNFIINNYSPEQRSNLELLLKTAVQKEQLNTFVSLLTSYYTDPNTLIARLQKIIK